MSAAKATRGLGTSPLDALVPPPPSDEVPGGRPARARPPSAKRTAKVSALISEEVAEAARNAVVALPARGVRVTLADIVEEGMRRVVEELAHEHNGGEAFPDRGEPGLPVGRPIPARRGP